MINKLLMILEDNEVFTEPSNYSGSNYRIKDFDPILLRHVLRLMGGTLVAYGQGFVGMVTLPVRIKKGIHKKFSLVLDLEGHAAIEEVGFVVLRGSETLTVPTLEDAEATVKDKMVGDLA